MKLKKRYVCYIAVFSELTDGYLQLNNEAKLFCLWRLDHKNAFLSSELNESAKRFVYCLKRNYPLGQFGTGKRTNLILEKERSG